MCQRRAAGACRAATPPFARMRISRSLVLSALPLLVAITSAHAAACDTARKDYFGRCVEVKSPPAKLLKFLADYGQQVGKVGDVADLFAPDIPLFDKPESGRKPVYFPKGPDVDIKSEARIERVLPDFYYVTVSIYDGPTSCGIDEFRAKGPKATLRGYVPRTNPQDIPSLWKFRRMTGLC
jgi:hypothetical protein